MAKQTLTSQPQPNKGYKKPPNMIGKAQKNTGKCQAGNGVSGYFFGWFMVYRMSYGEHDEGGSKRAGGINGPESSFGNSKIPYDFRHIQGNKKGLPKAGKESQQPAKAHLSKIAFYEIKKILQSVFFPILTRKDKKLQSQGKKIGRFTTTLVFREMPGRLAPKARFYSLRGQ